MYATCERRSTHQEEATDDRDTDGRHSLAGHQNVCRSMRGTDSHNEEPSPASDAVHTVELEHTSSDQTAESVSDLLRDVQSAESLTQLVFGVPSTEQVDCAREEDGLDNTKDDSDTK